MNKCFKISHCLRLGRRRVWRYRGSLQGTSRARSGTVGARPVQQRRTKGECWLSFSGLLLHRCGTHALFVPQEWKHAPFAEHMCLLFWEVSGEKSWSACALRFQDSARTVLLFSDMRCSTWVKVPFWSSWFKPKSLKNPQLRKDRVFWSYCRSLNTSENVHKDCSRTVLCVKLRDQILLCAYVHQFQAKLWIFSWGLGFCVCLFLIRSTPRKWPRVFILLTSMFRRYAMHVCFH